MMEYKVNKVPNMVPGFTNALFTLSLRLDRVDLKPDDVTTA